MLALGEAFCYYQKLGVVSQTFFQKTKHFLYRIIDFNLNLSIGEIYEYVSIFINNSDQEMPFLLLNKPRVFLQKKIVKKKWTSNVKNFFFVFYYL